MARVLDLDELVEDWTLLDDERDLGAGKRGPTRIGSRRGAIEAPAAGRMAGMGGWALDRAELTLAARIAGRLPAGVADRLRALVVVEVPNDDAGEESVLALIKSVPGNVSLESM